MNLDSIRQIGWLEFKSFVETNNLSIQYIEDSQKYELIAIKDGVLAKNCILKKYNTEYVKDFEAIFKPSSNVSLSTAIAPYVSKSIGAKQLYKRDTGIQAELIIGENIILWTIPNAQMKFTGVEVMGGELLDHASLYILDSADGQYTTIPNYVLNQFGFTMNIAKDYYCRSSNFEGDVFINMQIKIVYFSVSVKKIGINFFIDELK